MELAFRVKQTVVVDGRKDVGEIISANIREYINSDGEIATEGKYLVKFTGTFSHWYEADMLTLSIENMDYIDPKQREKIDKVIIDAHIDNKNFDAIREMNSNEDVVE